MNEHGREISKIAKKYGAILSDERDFMHDCNEYVKQQIKQFAEETRDSVHSGYYLDIYNDMKNPLKKRGIEITYKREAKR